MLPSTSSQLTKASPLGCVIGPSQADETVSGVRSADRRICGPRQSWSGGLGRSPLQGSGLMEVLLTQAVEAVKELAGALAV